MSMERAYEQDGEAGGYTMPRHSRAERAKGVTPITGSVPWGSEGRHIYQRIGQWLWECQQASGLSMYAIAQQMRADGFEMTESRLSRLASLRKVKPDGEQPTPVRYLDLLTLMYLNRRVWRKSDAEMIAFLHGDQPTVDGQDTGVAREQAESLRLLMLGIRNPSLRDQLMQLAADISDVDRRMSSIEGRSATISHLPPTGHAAHRAEASDMDADMQAIIDAARTTAEADGESANGTDGTPGASASDDE